jgi:hypothetical protein
MGGDLGYPDADDPGGDGRFASVLKHPPTCHPAGHGEQTKLGQRVDGLVNLVVGKVGPGAVVGRSPHDGGGVLEGVGVVGSGVKDDELAVAEVPRDDVLRRFGQLAATLDGHAAPAIVRPV